MSTPLRHLRQVQADERAPAPGPDWAAQTADTIDKVVTSIRSKTADPADRAVRIVVYGVLAGVLGVTALVLLSVALFRAVDVAIPGEVWSAYLVVGGIFSLVGLFLWTKRRAPDAPS
jgi:hypothetical protein